MAVGTCMQQISSLAECSIKFYTLLQSDVRHWAQGVNLQLRNLGSDGWAARQAASLTLIVNVADISCLQCKSRVWTPSPQEALHGLHSLKTHLLARETWHIHELLSIQQLRLFPPLFDWFAQSEGPSTKWWARTLHFYCPLTGNLYSNEIRVSSSTLNLIHVSTHSSD